MRTYGVAIPVPEPHGSWLRDQRLGFGDLLAETIPTHVTLVPPTEVPKERIDEVEFALAEVASHMPAFTMRLLGTGSFRPVSPVVFVAVAEGISYTEVLATSIRESLALGDPEFPFHPHVTVAQHLDDAALDRAAAELSGFTAEFAVDSFRFYLHDDVDGWVTAREFMLTG